MQNTIPQDIIKIQKTCYFWKKMILEIIKSIRKYLQNISNHIQWKKGKFSSKLLKM